MSDITGPLTIISESVTANMICSAVHQDERDPNRLAGFLFEGQGNGLSQRVRSSTILVVGKGFGNGINGDVPVRALRAAGIKCIVSPRYGREFYRAAINGGLALIEADMMGEVSDGDQLTVDLADGIITHAGNEIAFDPYPEPVRLIIERGGLLPAVKTSLGKT